METRAASAGSSPEKLPLFGWGDPNRTPGKMDKPLRCRPLEGRRDQKSPLRRCFELRPPWRAGYAGLASGYRSLFGTRLLADPGSLPRGYPSPESEPLSLATVRPLVRMSTDRHAATGTCRIGQGGRYGRTLGITRAFRSQARISVQNPSPGRRRALSDYLP